MEPVDAEPSILPLKTDKRERKHTAQMLPPGITQQMMKKYVVYYREFVNLKNGKRVPREYFKVESHPKLSRPWVTSKSGKISLHEKLEQANQFVADLETTTTTTTTPPSTAPTAKAEEKFTVMSTGGNEISHPVAIERKYLPKYTTLRVIRQTSSSSTLSLVYDQKDHHNGFRWTCSHTFTVPTPPDSSKPPITETSISLEISKLKQKIYEKYAVDLME